MVEAAGEFRTKTTAPDQPWQTDFTYLKVVGWGWFHLSTALDDLSRHVVAWRPCAGMAASDVTDTLELALAASGRTQARARHRPRLLSDNGPGHIPGELATWLAGGGMEHVRGAPCRPQTQGEIGRRHRTLENRVLLENHHPPGDLEAQVAASVEHHNHRRHHGSLENLAPADVCFGRGRAVLLERGRIKRRTTHQRRSLHHSQAA